ncbi:MAG: di-heme oxidoredictase family protein [Candidatus Methylumidiphilus sp.]
MLGVRNVGYIEMLARQITSRLQSLRNGLAAGQSVKLLAYGIDFGQLSRKADGSWDASGVKGLPPPSISSTGPSNPPSLLILPFHQAGAVVSLRVFTNNALNHHHGIQSTERFGLNVDADQDGIANETTRADVTALTVFQATLPPPGRLIPRNRDIENAVRLGEDKFVAVGCASCHIPALPLVNNNQVYSEPNPYNPAGNLQPGSVSKPLTVDLNSYYLPFPRLDGNRGVTWVPAFTDFKLHDITSGQNDPNREPINMQFKPGSAQFRAGNGQFITRKLWGIANEPPFFHHGMFTTLREAVEAHAGEASTSMAAYRALSSAEQDAIIEFLKTLQVVRGTPYLTVNEFGIPRPWRNFPYNYGQHLEGYDEAKERDRD